MTETAQSTNQSTILKELSDIKTSLAVNTNETANIKIAVVEIKTAVNEMKGDYISRREFSDKTKELDEKCVARFTVGEGRTADLYRIVYWVIGVFALAFLGALIKLVIIK